jgi:hypothetical protein
MNEVSEFLSANPDMGHIFHEFAAQYSSLAEVWENSPHSGWMLWVLYKRNYRNAEKLERYLGWLREQIVDYDDAVTAQLRQRYVDFHSGYVEELEEELKRGGVTKPDARFRRFISAWLAARFASDYVLNNKVADAQFNNLFMKFEKAQEGIELQIPVFDEVSLRLDGLKEQADRLREFMGNPFALAQADDFHYGRSLG